MAALQMRLLNPWHVLLALLVGVLGLAGCADTANTERINSLTRADPDEQRNKAARRLALASAYFEQGQNEVAQQEVRAALLIDANYAQAYNLLGLIHQRDRAMDLAEQSFEQALKLATQPASRPADLATVQHNYAWFLCEQGRFEQAQIQFERALRQPGYAQAGKTWMALGLCQIRAGQRTQGKTSLINAVAADTHNAVARYQLAVLAYQDGDLQEAQNYLMPVHAEQSFSAESLWLGVRLAHTLKQEQEERRLSELLLKNFPDSPQAKSLTQRNFDQP
jgi:type IV pilus assembly protein PilF